jgi:hypothetical protein
MANRFYGKVGYGATVETAPGVWKDVITEVPYYGDVIRNTRVLREGDRVNDDLSVGNSISIVADAYANENIFAMRYVEWKGALWVVTDVQVQSPRLLLTLGGVYNGPKPT